MRFSLVVISFCLPVLGWAQNWGLNDISVLVPLPSHQELPLTLGSSARGPKGALLSMDLTTRFPKLIPEHSQDHTFKNLLKVVAVRLDPCFTEGTGPQKCRKQIRLVWQPLIPFGEKIITRDAALHTFYQFDDAEWLQVIAAWERLEKTGIRSPLQIHPVLAGQGLQGVFWQQIKSLILEFCGEANLVRVTGMNVMNGEQLWSFLGYDVVAGELQRIMIPRIEHDIQGVLLGLSQPEEFNGRMIPAISTEPTLTALLTDSKGLRNGSNEREIRELMGRVYEFENPKMSNPGTLDCVTCHLAQSTRQWGQKNFTAWDWKVEFQGQRYESSVILDNQSTQGFQTNQLRAFGYFADKSVISQRVINESAEILKSLPLALTTKELTTPTKTKLR